jgi:hypothetical protein
MRKNTLNFVVDVVTLLTMLFMVLTGLLLEFILPPRRGAGSHQTLWGWDRHDWGDVHFWTAVGLGGLLLIHVALHWKWVCVTVGWLLQRGEERARPAPAPIRNAYGVVFLALIVAVVGGFLWLASANVQSELRGPGRGGGTRVERGAGGPLADDADAGRGRGVGGAGRAAGELHIRGSTTLAEIEQATGIPVATLRAELGLPVGVAADERLGRLRQEHGFEMSDVREVVERLRPRPTNP